MTQQLDFELEESADWGAPCPTGITVCGAAFEADISGALYWPEHRLLIVSDLHLEQGAASAARGSMLPPYDTAKTLTRLEAVLDRYKPARVISLGDSFHTVDVANGLDPQIADRIVALQEDREWYWVTGNHDPDLPASIKGRVCPSVTLGRLRFRHEPIEGPSSREIAGHLHPAARLSRRGTSVRRKCFVTDGGRLIMPAFGAYTGGLNVLSAPFKPMFGSRDILVWMLGRDAVYPISKRQLQGD